MRYGQIDKAYAMQLATVAPDQDGPALMVNFMKYREVASYATTEAGAPISGREADDRYAPTDVLRAIGASVVYYGDVVGDDGQPDPAWDRMGIVLYPTRRSFIEMQSRRDFQDKHVHKEAGMQFTINMTAIPTGPWAGEDGGSSVTFVAWPEGSEPVAPGNGALLAVEGTILGDGRRWSHLGVHHEHVDRRALPAEVIVARTLPTRDTMRRTIDTWT